MRVKIRLMGLLKRACGKEEILMQLSEGAKLKDAIFKLLEEEEALKEILIDPELKDPRPNTIILVGGREISVLGGLEAELKDEDEIVIIPVIHGGLSAQETRI
ncbi:MAG: MoaD/ThiS family protein [Candidatus Bathyarchaeia archaeon]